MTNGDVIRKMNDDQIANFLIKYKNDEIDTAKTFCDLCDVDEDCDECVRWWVKNDAEMPQGLEYSR